MGETRVITYGTFDLLHYGHIELLRRAKQLGDYLIVAVSTDEFNAGKGKRAYFDYEKRKDLVEAIKYVDEVIPEETWDQKRTDVQEHDVDVFVMGADWEGKFDELGDLCRVVYLERTPHISSTALRAIHPQQTT
jgi:glycerol-3-phosphate cytidylyltransferase